MMTMVMVITSKQLISRIMKVVKLLMIAWGITELVKEMVANSDGFIVDDSVGDRDDKRDD